MKTWQKILFVIMIVIIIIILILFIKSLTSKPTTEGYISKMDESKDPVSSYVDSWIKSVKNLYSVKEPSQTEQFAQSRTLRDFNALQHLDKDPITTGKYK